MQTRMVVWSASLAGRILLCSGKEGGCGYGHSVVGRRVDGGQLS